MATPTAEGRVESGVKSAIYQAMVDLIYERGYHAASLRQVASSVGIQMASIYYHFPSKQDLLDQIMTNTLQQLVGSVREAVRLSEQGSKDKLSAAIRAHIAFHTERRKEAFVADSELRALEPQNRQAIVALRDEYEEIFRTILEKGLLAGAFAVDDVPLSMKALMAMCTQVAVWYQPGGRLALGQIAETYTELFLKGVLSRSRGMQGG